MPNSSCKDFWIFSTSERLHSYGSTSKSNSIWFLEPPSSIVELHTYEEWKDLLESKSKNYESQEELFNNNVNHSKHNFKVGMMVEALNPMDRTQICPATVTKIIDDVYFLVNIDTQVKYLNTTDDIFTNNNLENNTWLCTAKHPYIFPVGWAQKNNIA